MRPVFLPSVTIHHIGQEIIVKDTESMDWTCHFVNEHV